MCNVRMMHRIRRIVSHCVIVPLWWSLCVMHCNVMYNTIRWRFGKMRYFGILLIWWNLGFEWIIRILVNWVFGEEDGNSVISLFGCDLGLDDELVKMCSLWKCVTWVYMVQCVFIVLVQKDFNDFTSIVPCARHTHTHDHRSATSCLALAQAPLETFWKLTLL